MEGDFAQSVDEFGNELIEFCDGDDADGRKEILEIDIHTEIIRVRFPTLSLHIRIADMLCLAEGELLNGTIIDFYLNHISSHLVHDSSLRMHIFPSLFWCNLKSWSRNLHIYGAGKFGTYDDSVSDPSCVNYWLEEEDVFDADILVFPVNDYNHWSLTIVLVPYTNAEISICEPLVIIFDSQQFIELSSTEDVADIIKTFLLSLISQLSVRNEFLTLQIKIIKIKKLLIPEVWAEVLFIKRFDKHASESSGRKENFMTKEIRTVIPKNLPQQENDVDCGLFVLEYAQHFLLHPPIKDLALHGNFDFNMHYPNFNVSSKRQNIRKALMTLCVDRNRWSRFFGAEQ